MTEAKEFFEVIKERLRNPFFGHFIFFWIYFNWRPLFILLDFKYTIIDRLSLIDENFVSVFNNFLFPFLLAFSSYVGINYLMFYTDKLTSHGKRIRKDLVNKNLILDFEGKKDVAEAQYKYEEAKQNYKNLKSLNDKITELNNQVTQLTEANKKLSSDLEKAKEGLTFQKQIDRQEDIEREIDEIFYKSGMRDEQSQFLKNIKILEYHSYIENLKNHISFSYTDQPSEILMEFCKKNNLTVNSIDKSKPLELTLKGFFILWLYIRQKAEERYPK